MTRRRLLWAGTALLLIPAVGLLVWPTRPGYEQIKEGMTLQDVNALLGAEPDSYYCAMCQDATGDLFCIERRTWRTIEIHFRSDFVLSKSFKAGRTLPDRLRVWLGW